MACCMDLPCWDPHGTMAFEEGRSGLEDAVGCFHKLQGPFDIVSEPFPGSPHFSPCNSA